MPLSPALASINGWVSPLRFTLAPSVMPLPTLMVMDVAGSASPVIPFPGNVPPIAEPVNWVLVSTFRTSHISRL